MPLQGEFKVVPDLHWVELRILIVASRSHLRQGWASHDPCLFALGREITKNIFSVLGFIKNQNGPLIGQRKITPPKSKRRFSVEIDFWAHRKEEVANDFDFFLSKSKIKNVEFGFVEGFIFYFSGRARENLLPAISQPEGNGKL